MIRDYISVTVESTKDAEYTKADIKLIRHYCASIQHAMRIPDAYIMQHEMQHKKEKPQLILGFCYADNRNRTCTVSH